MFSFRLPAGSGEFLRYVGRCAQDLHVLRNLFSPHVGYLFSCPCLCHRDQFFVRYPITVAL